MRAWIILGGVVAVVAVVLLLTSGPSASQEVETKVQELAQAISRHDYRGVCRDVLAPALVARLGLLGAPCPQTLRVVLHDVRNPVVSIGKVTVKGMYASAITLTVARGQKASLSKIELIQTPQGWRITSLGAPLTQGTAGP